MVTSRTGLLIACLPGTLIIGQSSLGARQALPDWVSRMNRLAPKLNLEHEHGRGQKLTVTQYLKAIRKNLPIQSLRDGIRFC